MSGATLGRVPLARRARRCAVALVAVVALAASCHRSPGVQIAPMPAPSVEWPAVLGDARRAWAAGRFEDAERVLTGFAAQFAGSREAGEVLFWRAVLELDPTNEDGSTKAATQTLDAYLALDSIDHRDEAMLLHRVAGLITSLSADVQAAKAAPLPQQPPPPLLREKDEEILRLRDSLTKTSAELERVRKRLAPKS